MPLTAELNALVLERGKQTIQLGRDGAYCTKPLIWQAKLM